MLNIGVVSPQPTRSSLAKNMARSVGTIVPKGPVQVIKGGLKKATEVIPGVTLEMSDTERKPRINAKIVYHDDGGISCYPSTETHRSGIRTHRNIR